MPGCVRTVAGQFQQMCSNRVQAVMFHEAGVRCGRIQQLRRAPMYHRRGDRVIQSDHRVVGHPHKKTVKRQNLWPICVLDPCRLIVNGCNGGLQLVWANRAFGQGRRDERHPSAICCPSQSALF